MRRAIAMVGLLCLGIAAGPESAWSLEHFGVHAEGGFGLTAVNPLVSPVALGASTWAGLTASPLARIRPALEFGASLGDDIGGRVPEGPFSGRRTLVTFLLGGELIGPAPVGATFVMAGLGVGHMTLSGATRGWRDFPATDWRTPPRNLTALGFGAGAGIRGAGIQVAIRYHGIVHSQQIASSAVALTLGVAL